MTPATPIYPSWAGRRAWTIHQKRYRSPLGSLLDVLRLHLVAVRSRCPQIPCVSVDGSHGFSVSFAGVPRGARRACEACGRGAIPTPFVSPPHLVAQMNTRKSVTESTPCASDRAHQLIFMNARGPTARRHKAVAARRTHVIDVKWILRTIAARTVPALTGIRDWPVSETGRIPCRRCFAHAAGQ